MSLPIVKSETVFIPFLVLELLLYIFFPLTFCYTVGKYFYMYFNHIRQYYHSV